MQTEIPAQTILVVGGSGFIGLHTVRQLAAAGHAVFATHSPASAPAATPGVTWLPCDLARPDLTNSWPGRCDSVLYLAQARQWRSFPGGAADMVQVNVDAVLRTLVYALQAGAGRFVFTSTGSVYSQTVRPAREEEPIDLGAARSFYAASKLAAELLLGPYGKLLPVVILRPFVPYGTGQGPDMLLPQLTRRVSEGQPVKLHGRDGLRANPVAVADVARVLELCLSLTASVTLNVAGPELLTLREIVATIGRGMGRTPVFEVQPGLEPPVIAGAMERLHATLGWAPQTTLEEGLQHSLVANAGTCAA